MNKRFLYVLIFAFVVSLGASLVIYRLISGKIASSEQRPTTAVVVAARDLEIGSILKSEDLKQGEWVGAAPQAAVLKAEDALGRGVTRAIFSGEPILETRLAPKGAGGGLAATIPNGMRAVAVRVNDVASVAGFVVPGMRVDLIINGNPPGGSAGGTMAKTILQNIEILSAGTNIQKDAEGKPQPVPVVNVLATPEQAEILSLASNQTTIQMVLRNPLDTEEAEPPGTNLQNIFSGQKGSGLRPGPVQVATRQAPVARPAAPAPPKVEPPPPPPLVVEVITGTSRTKSQFEQKREVKP
jgi:pilus assembly protein CpaB